MTLQVSAFTDEASVKVDDQIRLAQTLGLRSIALRFLDPRSGIDNGRRNIITLTPAEAREIQRKVEDAGLTVSVLGSPIGKRTKTISEPGVDAVTIQRVIEQEVKPLTDILATLKFPRVRIFGGNRAQTTPFATIRNQVIDQVGEISEQFRRAGAFVEIEHEPFTAIATPEDLLEVCEAMKEANIGAIIDEANGLLAGYAGKPGKFIDILDRLASYVTSFHIKCLDPTDHGINPEGWTNENQVTKFRVLQGQVYEAAFGKLAANGARLSSRAATCMAVLEPHLDHSDRFFGCTTQANFIAAGAALRAFARRFAVETDMLALAE